MRGICSVDGCHERVHVISRGLCSAHYQRMMIYGDPLGGGKKHARKGEPIRFIIETALSYAGDDCLLWPYAKAGRGYGTLSIDGRLSYAHRFVCELSNGPPPTPRHEAAHSCGNGHLGCVSPHHLRWATRRENHADKIEHGTHNRGERCASSKLTAAEVLEIRSLAGALPQSQIGAKFGVSQTTAGQIIRRARWGWLNGPSAPPLGKSAVEREFGARG